MTAAAGQLPATHPPRRAGPLPWAEAYRRAYADADPLPQREVALAAAAGAVLAAPLVAAAPLPPFDTAAMDGYAVAGAGPWRLAGRLLAGQPPAPGPGPGQAHEIATGAVVPPGVAAVIPYEHSDLVAGVVHGDVQPGRHIRRTGEECAPGEPLVPPGREVSPAVLGLAAAVGLDRLTVRPRPTVVLLVTGSELLSAGLPGDGRIRDAVGPMLPGLVTAAGGTVVEVRQLPDDRAALAAAVGAARADVVVTSGASSVGPADHLPGVLADLGATYVVDRVRCSPGGPQSLARLADGRRVVGLPGNPLAAVAGVVTLVVPLLARLGGRPAPRSAPARLVPPVQPRPDRTRLLPVATLGTDLDGTRVAEATGHAGAAMLRGLALADAFAVLAPSGGCELLSLPG